MLDSSCSEEIGARMALSERRARTSSRLGGCDTMREARLENNSTKIIARRMAIQHTNLNERAVRRNTPVGRQEHMSNVERHRA